MIRSKTIYCLLLFVLLLINGVYFQPSAYAATKVEVESVAPASSREEGRRRMIDVVGKFRNDPQAKQLNEAQTRKYIDEFLRCLGWDAGNFSQEGLYSQDTIPEARLFLSNTVRFVDYKQRIDDQVLMVEAKRVNVDCNKQEYRFQAKRYCWSSMKAEVTLLTNFRQLIVFDAREKPLLDAPRQGEIQKFTMGFEDYVSNFDLLFDTFSKESVARGSLRKMLDENNPELKRALVDQVLIKQMDALRLKLAADIQKNNPGATVEELNAATHNLLNKILFCRILEDRDIEPTGVLRLKVSHYYGDALLDGSKPVKKPNAASLHEFITAEFTGRMQTRYRGVIFRPHAGDQLKVSDDVLRDVIMTLYPADSANKKGGSFDFSVMPVDVIGHIYEGYLGKRIIIADGKVKLEPTPSVREAGGVFYTPDNIAQFLVTRTLRPLIDGKSPQELTKLRIVDPASGSGALLLQSARALFAEAREYYAKHPEAIGNRDSEFPDAIIHPDGSVKLSPFIKAALVENCIYGVDIDKQANEIAAMWLYMLILENENFSIVDAERKANLPTRSKKADRPFSLPDMSGNLVCGNSLVEPDFSNDPAENARVQAFDWMRNGTKIEVVMRTGGFDAVVGNPPYISYLSMNRLIPDQLRYFRKKYKSMGYRQPDMAFAFVERGTQIANRNGVLGYILTNRFLFNQSAVNLRKLLSEQQIVNEIINFGNAKLFSEARVYTSLLFLDMKRTAKVRYAELRIPSSLNDMLQAISVPVYSCPDYFITEKQHAMMIENDWLFSDLKSQSVLELMNSSAVRLSQVADCTQGIQTGNNDVFIVNLIESKGELSKISSSKNPDGFWIETKILTPFLRPRKFVSYAPAIPNQYVIYPYSSEGIYSEDFMKKNFPLAWEYLTVHKQSLENRKVSKWYALYRPRNYKLIHQPKILVALGGNAQIDLDGKILFPGGGLNCAVIPTQREISLYSLAGIVNSKLVAIYMKALSADLEGRTLYSAEKLAKLPIPAFNEKTAPLYTQLDKLVREIVGLKKANPNANTSLLEKQVDSLVEKLYKVAAEAAKAVKEAA